MFQEQQINHIPFNQPSPPEIPELWGGIECSIIRTKNGFTDQLQLSKHYDRHSDIQRIAELGVKVLRFPILYEKHKPFKDIDTDWSWADKRINDLSLNGITPIVGLIHHGSGPTYTNLNSPDFAKGLASFAGEVATRYPTLEYYTPVNEPLTTARFSGLYGIWYPHQANDRSFCRMFINQLKAIVLSMQEIRKINPAAKLIQTEDLGKVYSNKSLQYQVNFENERRWLTFDLLCGRVDSDHTFWRYLTDNGISVKSLEFFLNNPCPPYILGLNYYVTSERFLDDNLSAYPTVMHGGNGIEKYVDTEAVRVPHDHQGGLPVLLKEVHSRYNLKMALTEVHLNCTREEQLRWFKEIWETCSSLKNEGIDIKAVTAWSIFGAYGWNKLLTSPQCDYEPGVFDLRAPLPRETALASMLRAFSSGNSFDHPVLSQQGWWRRPERYFNRFHDASDQLVYEKNIRPVMIIGNNAALTNAFSQACQHRCIPYLVKSRNDLNLDEKELHEQISTIHPWAIIDASRPLQISYTATRHNEINTTLHSTSIIAAYCRKHGIKLLTISSDNIFSGNTSIPYTESTLPDAQGESGLFALQLEQQIMSAYPESLLVRTGFLFGFDENENMIQNMRDTLRNGKVVHASTNVFFSLSYVPDVVNTSMDLLIDNEKGICHLVNKGIPSMYDIALAICKHEGFAPDLVHAVNSNDLLNNPVLLESERSWIMPDINCALSHYIGHYELKVTQTEEVLQHP